MHVTSNGQGGASLLCSCPFAKEALVCEHIWAALLEADAQGSLEQALPLTTPAPSRAGRGGRVRTVRAARSVVEPERGWRQRLRQLGERMADAAADAADDERTPWPADRRLAYIVDLAATLRHNALVVELCTERQRRDGSWGPPKQYSLGADRLASLPDARDRQLVQMLVGANSDRRLGQSVAISRDYTLPEASYSTVLRLMCETGRCRLRRDPLDEQPTTLEWDDGEPWRFHLHVQSPPHGTGYRVEGILRRGARAGRPADDEPGESMEIAAPALVLRHGLLIAEGKVARLDHGSSFTLLSEMRTSGPMAVPAADLPDLLETLYSLPHLPPVELPEGLGVVQSSIVPTPELMVGVLNEPAGGASSHLALTVTFRYGDVEVAAERAERAIFDRRTRRVTLRDLPSEERAMARLHELGARRRHDRETGLDRLTLQARRLDRAVRALTAEGWRVEAEGRLYRPPGESRSAIRSGVDWFELDAAVSYGDQQVPLPRLLAALKRGERTVLLDDGSLGILPEEWLRRYAPLASAAVSNENDLLRYSRSQVALLDAMLETMPEVTADGGLTRLRASLHDALEVGPAPTPEGFKGTLRPYQREGLGWMHYLRQLEMGGCLADDMGLGKTIQVLALLESRRVANAGPSLLVVPRSLVFNWKQEAARFTPRLRVLDHTDPARDRRTLTEKGHHVVLATYGTLRRDVAALREVEFDYAILDEAQAIKNHHTASAKAARLLRAKHRLAMSGTPVENRLEELWSLFEFLNPGMLGPSRLFNAAGDGAGSADTEGGRLLARALRPFILRRTKAQVARDLPEKQEQTLYVQMKPRQRKLYDELREHYRASLLGVVDQVGMKRARIQILEALLRLRQAACHPALLDPHGTTGEDGVREDGAKLEALLPMLRETTAEGHKVLVFSQFTSFLALLRSRLDAEGMGYEYLDGRTRDRQARVERFQEDPDRRLFLISLKAGGQGLNLTAADYVFLLDPWWNPAVEAQAIDRAHRIGQQRPVLATRLITQGTVEERVMELQRTKRELADAVITADNSVLARMEREDLELLLG